MPDGSIDERGGWPALTSSSVSVAGSMTSVDERRHRQRAEAQHQAVDRSDHGGGRVAVGGVGAHRGPQLRHHRRGLDAAPDDVADRQRDAPAGEREDVVPVAAQAAARGGQVAGVDSSPNASP